MKLFLFILFVPLLAFGQLEWKKKSVGDPSAKRSTATSSSLLTSLQAYWKLDEASSNATDSQAGIVLTNTSVSYTTGITNNGANFTADGQYLEVGDLAALSFGDEDFTISCWYKGASTSGTQIFLSKWGASGQWEYMFWFYGAIEKFYWSISSNGSTGTDVVSTNAYAVSTWYHIVAQHDSVNNLTKIKVNNTGWITAPLITGCRDGTTAFRLGHSVSGSTGTRAVLDEVGLWRRCLTDAEITTLYNSGNALPYPF